MRDVIINTCPKYLFLTHVFPYIQIHCSSDDVTASPYTKCFDILDTAQQLLSQLGKRSRTYQLIIGSSLRKIRVPISLIRSIIHWFLLRFSVTSANFICHMLQQDLDKLTQWSKTWGMQFNVKKCNIISITNATKHKISHQYLMDGEIVSPTDTTDYLGVRFNGKLRWNQHIDHISSAANRMLGFLWRNLYKCPQELKEKASKTMIRPKVEYCASIWYPHHTKYIDKLESVQRRAARFVTNQPHRRSEPVVSVTAMIQDLGWEPLSTRRLQSRLTSFYKVLNHNPEIPQSYHPVPAQDLQDTRGHDKRFQTYQPEIGAYKSSFFPRTVVDWNKLPAKTVHAESIEACKLRLCASRE